MCQWMLDRPKMQEKKEEKHIKEKIKVKENSSTVGGWTHMEEWHHISVHHVKRHWEMLHGWQKRHRSATIVEAGGILPENVPVPK